jgi:hypothetical protein
VVYRARLARADGAVRRIVVDDQQWGASFLTYGSAEVERTRLTGFQVARRLPVQVLALLPEDVSCYISAEGDGGRIRGRVSPPERTRRLERPRHLR